MIRQILVTFIVTQVAVCSSSFGQSCKTKDVQSIPGSPCSGAPFRVASCDSTSLLQSIVDESAYMWNFSSSECTSRIALDTCSWLSVVLNATITPKADSAWAKASCAAAAKCLPQIGCASDADCTEYNPSAYNLGAVSYCGAKPVWSPEIVWCCSATANLVSSVCKISDADLSNYISKIKPFGCKDTDCDSNILSLLSTASVPSSVTIDGLNSDLESVVHFQCDTFKVGVAQSVKTLSGAMVGNVHVSKVCNISSCKKFSSATRRSQLSIPAARDVGTIQSGGQASVVLKPALKAFIFAQDTLHSQDDSYHASFRRVSSLSSSETSIDFEVEVPSDQKSNVQSVLAGNQFTAMLAGKLSKATGKNATLRASGGTTTSASFGILNVIALALNVICFRF